MTACSTSDNSLFNEAWKSLDSSQAPFQMEWRNESIYSRPLEGLKIYHNIPLSIETVCKVEALRAAGADVVVSSTDFLVPATFTAARKLIQDAGIEYRAEKHAQEGEFDFHLDCCAELRDLPPPRYGAVELTRTGALLYQSKELSYPVLSIDNSHLKALETFKGTGEAFVRAFRELSAKDPSEEVFALLGYGKVGQGVADQLQDLGAKVIVFDLCSDACSLARKHGFDAYLCTDESSTREALKDTSVVVTATGHVDALRSSFPNAEEQLAGKTLCNIGAEDEIGEGFADSIVLAAGQTINFTLRHPTIMRYLDPSFFAHNAGIQMLIHNKFSAGFHSLPEEYDRQVVLCWASIHGESIERILES